tara:strand:+ start:714 stop:1934 length:1221 start_codon:yes stop_codon:yes gene_type:complete
MHVCIHRDLLGSSRHFIADKSRDYYSWSSLIPSNAWVFGGPDNTLRCAGSVLKAIDVEVDDSPGEKYVNAWNRIGKTCKGDVDWEKALPPDVFKTFVSKLLDQLWCVFESVDDTYYGKEFLIGRNLILGLKKASIDIDIFNYLSKESNKLSNIRSLGSFSPDKDGWSQKPVYSMTSSITGRLTITSGPNILTMRKDLRRIIKSRYKNGKIFQIDFTSLEPRILLLMQGISAPRDIYTHISKEVLGGNATREVSKLATLGAIFGISAARLQESTGLSDTDSLEILKEVRRYFKTAPLGKSLKNEIMEMGYIENIYGRRVVPSSRQSHVLINNKVQSSGVDVSLLGFSDLLKSFDREGVTSIPLFLIHDSIIIDVPADHVKKAIAVVSEGVYNKKFKTKFPLTVEEII